MTKIQIMSDLHNEFGLKSLVKTDAEIVILAGDIGVGKKTAKWIIENFPKQKVIYITGNHEYYHGFIDVIEQDIRKITKGTDVKYLQNNKIILKGIRFLGTTLWTDFKIYGDNLFGYYKNYCYRSISDFSVIKQGHERFTPDAAIELHEISRKFLEKNLSKMYNGKTVVVTHHAPLRECIGPEFKDSPLNPAFVVDMSDLVEKYKPDIWIYGHTHGHFRDFKYDKTRFICNPRGYPGSEYSEFIPDFTINL